MSLFLTNITATARVISDDQLALCGGGESTTLGRAVRTDMTVSPNVVASSTIRSAGDRLEHGGNNVSSESLPMSSESLGRNALSITNCSKSFVVNRQSVPILDDISMDIRPGEFFCIVGGSGCGKSTLLNIIAGLERPTQGTVSMGDRIISKPGLDRGMVFQEHRLLPWLNVWQNIDFGLQRTVKDRDKIIAEHLKLVGLEGYEKAYPAQLSGGMAQRAGLARALVNRPQVLLLDEPFGALDALTRQQMQAEVLRLWEVEKTTMVLVTHDIDEALFLADRVAVLGGKPGRLCELYDIDLPRPRRRADTRFDELRNEIWNAIFRLPKGNAGVPE